MKTLNVSLGERSYPIYIGSGLLKQSELFKPWITMAAGSTYTPIATTTLGSNVASYTFSSIAGTYTDLVS